MAITQRCYLSGTSSSTSFSPSLTGWTNAGLGVSGTAPQPGDLVLMIAVVNSASATFSQSAGTPTWNIYSGPDIVHPTSGTTVLVGRVFNGTETTPTFQESAGNEILYTLVALAPDAGGTIGIDTIASTINSSTTGTSLTPPPATASGAGETSAIFAAWRNAASTAITETPPSGWIDTVEASFVGTSASWATDVAVQAGVSGTITPGGWTTNVTCTANFYNVLVQETISAITDVGVQNAGSSTSPSAGITATSSQPTELVVYVEADTLTSGTRTTPSGWTNRVNKINSTYGAIEMADKFVSSTGTFSGTWTSSATTPWSALIQSFRATKTPALVGVLNSGQAHGSGSGTNTISVACPVGTLVVVGVRVYGSQTLSAISDTKNNVWTIINAPPGGTNNVTCSLAWSILTTALTTSDTISCSTSSGGNYLMAAVGYSNIGTAAVYQKQVVSQAVNRSLTY